MMVPKLPSGDPWTCLCGMQNPGVRRTCSSCCEHRRVVDESNAKGEIRVRWGGSNPVNCSHGVVEIYAWPDGDIRLTIDNQETGQISTAILKPAEAARVRLALPDPLTGEKTPAQIIGDIVDSTHIARLIVSYVPPVGSTGLDWTKRPRTVPQALKEAEQFIASKAATFPAVAHVTFQTVAGVKAEDELQNQLSVMARKYLSERPKGGR